MMSRFTFSFCLLLASAVMLRAEPVPPTPAPAWQLKDLDGNVVSSDQFKGKVVVVDFWATWCPPCRAEIPGYVSLQQKYAKDGLVIVGVSVDQDPPAKVKKWVDAHNVSYTIVMQDDDVTTAFGGMDAIPTTFLIDRDGNIRDKKVGAEPTAEYEKKILTYLNQPAAK
jgi:thiol-disulfide isomerase/thioredoxin